MRAIASSIIWPSMVPTPLAFSAKMARALSTASALGVSAALIAAICAGWMAALAAKPSATAAATSCLRPASSRRSKNGASIGVTPAKAQAAMSRPRAKASGAHGRPEIGRHVGGAQHQAGKARRRRRDRLDRGEPARALDQADEPGALARRGQQAVEDLKMAGRLRLGQYQNIRCSRGSEQRVQVRNARPRVEPVDPQRVARTIGRVIRQVFESDGPGLRLVPRRHRVLKIHDRNVGAGRGGLRETVWTGCRRK